MANFPYFDPGDSEVLSPLLAGLTEGLNKLSEILNLTTSSQTNVTMENMTWVNEDGRTVVGKLYQAPQGKKMWVSSPAPVIKKNGTVITPINDHFTIDYVGGSLFFDDGYILQDSDVVTADFTFVNPNSSVIDSLSQAAATLEDISADVDERLSGVEYMSYQNDFLLPIATDDSGVTLIVDDDGLAILAQWEYLQGVPGEYYNREETEALLEQREPEIIGKGDSPLAEEYYYNGRKQWSKLQDKVLESTLDGLQVDSSEPLTSTDTVLSAAGKLQAQVSERVAQAAFDEFKNNIPPQDDTFLTMLSEQSADGTPTPVNSIIVGDEYATEYMTHDFGNNAMFDVLDSVELQNILLNAGATYLVAETDGAGKVRFLSDKEIKALSNNGYVTIECHVYTVKSATASRGVPLTVPQDISVIKSKAEYRYTTNVTIPSISTQNTEKGWFESDALTLTDVTNDTVIDVLFNPSTLYSLTEASGSWIAIENSNGTVKAISDVSIAGPLELAVSYMRNI